MLKKLMGKIGLAVLLLGMFLAIAGTVKADCPWTVKGTIKVKAQDADLKTKFGEIIPLKGVRVKISAASAGVMGSEVFDAWDTVTTNSLGEFSLSREKSCTKRAFKIEVQFQNDNLELRVDFPPANVGGAVTGLVSSPPKWYLAIKESERNRAAGTVQFAPIVFDAGKNNDLKLREARDHADLWVMAMTLRDHLANMGSQFAFNEKTVIEYPNNDPVVSDNAEASFTNPANHNVNIFRSHDGRNDHLNISSVFHEMMHSWAFKHVSGELDLALNLVTSGSTHCFNDQEHISFHEGFAEFANMLLQNAIFNKTRRLPFNRDALKEGLTCEGRVNSIKTIRDIERHEYGWMSLFRMLTTTELYKYTYAGEATSNNIESSSVFISQRSSSTFPLGCSNPTNLHLKDILDVFLPHSNKGYTSNLTNREMNVDGFLNRAAKILNFESQRQGLKNLLDPAKTSEPKDELCGKMVPVQTPVIRRP